MARKKLSEKNIRKLTRMGGGRSLGLTLPIELMRKLRWRERQKVVVKLDYNQVRFSVYLVHSRSRVSANLL